MSTAPVIAPIASIILMEPATIEVLARSEESGSRDYLARQLSAHFRD